MKIAETLGYVTLGLTFGSQILVGLGALVNYNPSLQYALFVTGFTCLAVSFGTSVGATLMARTVKLELRRHYGSIALGISPRGVGIVYNIP